MPIITEYHILTPKILSYSKKYPTKKKADI